MIWVRPFLVGLISAHVSEKWPFFFHRSTDGSPWGSIHALQVALMQANDMNRCLSLLWAGIELLDKKVGYRHFLELIDTCESKPPISHDQILLVLIQARLLLAQILLELGCKEQFAFQPRRVRATINNLPWTQQQDISAPNFRTLKAYSEAPLNMENLSVRLNLASTMRENGNQLLETKILTLNWYWMKSTQRNRTQPEFHWTLLTWIDLMSSILV